MQYGSISDEERRRSLSVTPYSAAHEHVNFFPERAQIFPPTGSSVRAHKRRERHQTITFCSLYVDRSANQGVATVLTTNAHRECHGVSQSRDSYEPEANQTALRNKVEKEKKGTKVTVFSCRQLRYSRVTGRACPMIKATKRQEQTSYPKIGRIYQLLPALFASKPVLLLQHRFQLLSILVQISDNIDTVPPC